MKMFVGLAALAVVALIGLYVYGLTLSPETRLIEEEAVRASDE